MSERLGALFDLKSMAEDPYQWFLPFENQLKMLQNNGGGIAKYLSIKRIESAPEKEEGEDTMPLDEEGAKVIDETTKTEDIIAYDVVEGETVEEETNVESKFEKALTEKMQLLTLNVKQYQEDSEFPMRLFKDEAYVHQSKLKKDRLKKTEKKLLIDESRRLEIPVEKLRDAVEKRKNGIPISNFFKIRKLNEE